MPVTLPTEAELHVRSGHGVAELPQAYEVVGTTAARLGAGSRVAPSPPAMTREQYDEWTGMFAGSTIRELRHIRDVPRASTLLRGRPVLAMRWIEPAVRAAG